MTILVLGVALWWAAHLFKRVLPGPRAALAERMGEKSKGLFALAILASVVLMVIGYKAAPYVDVWYPPGWARHLNNLMMLVSVVFFGMGSSKGRLRAEFRHPMLMGFSIWAVAHLLVNGDAASVVLFGGLLFWALVEILLINAREPVWDQPEPGPPVGDVRLAVISLVVFAVIGLLHGWLGPWPFGGG